MREDGYSNDERDAALTVVGTLLMLVVPLAVVVLALPGVVPACQE